MVTYVVKEQKMLNKHQSKNYTRLVFKPSREQLGEWGRIY